MRIIRDDEGFGLMMIPLFVDWKEAFYILAVLISGDNEKEAKKYIDFLLRRPLADRALVKSLVPDCDCGAKKEEKGSDS